MSETIQSKAGRLFFYWGGSILLMFIAWTQIAPYAGSSPEWWNVDMARAAAVGVLFLVLSAAFMVSEVLAELTIPVLERWKADE